MENTIGLKTEKNEIIYFEVSNAHNYKSIIARDDENGGSMVEASGIGDRIQEGVSETIENSLEIINNMGNTIVDKLKKISNIDKAEVEFGFKIGGKGHIAFIASGEAEAHFTVKLFWEKLKEKPQVDNEH